MANSTKTKTAKTQSTSRQKIFGVGCIDAATYTAGDLEKLGIGRVALSEARKSGEVRPLKKVLPYRYRGSEINRWMESENDSVNDSADESGDESTT